MDTYTERARTLVTNDRRGEEKMKSYLRHAPLELEGVVYASRIAITADQRIGRVRELLGKDGFTLPLPTCN